MELLDKIALTLIPQVGAVLGRNLISYCGGVKNVFNASVSKLRKVPGIGEKTIATIRKAEVFERAKQELEFIRKNDIQALFYTDKKYPTRLKQCNDAPMMLYFNGTCDLNQSKVINIVGTRRASEYGRDVTQKIVEELSALNVLVVSGLAYGIDTCAHKAALENDLSTIGVLAHGLDRIYPQANAKLSNRMKEKGGVLTEFISGTIPDRENFPKRNRIVAGMCDATIVVESGIKGGALITAEIANSYNRDVFAIPGRINDNMSSGCNQLIRNNKAALIRSGEDVKYFMNWMGNEIVRPSKQTRLLMLLSPEEEVIVESFNGNNLAEFDQIANQTGFPSTQLVSLLLNLEFQGVLKCLPGKVYKLLN